MDVVDGSFLLEEDNAVTQNDKRHCPAAGKRHLIQLSIAAGICCLAN